MPTLRFSWVRQAFFRPTRPVGLGAWGSDQDCSGVPRVGNYRNKQALAGSIEGQHGCHMTLNHARRLKNALFWVALFLVVIASVRLTDSAASLFYHGNDSFKLLPKNSRYVDETVDWNYTGMSALETGLERFADLEGIPLLIPTRRFREEARRGLVFRHDLHYNERGHALMADEIGRFLSRTLLEPPPLR